MPSFRRKLFEGSLICAPYPPPNGPELIRNLTLCPNSTSSVWHRSTPTTPLISTSSTPSQTLSATQTSDSSTTLTMETQAVGEPTPSPQDSWEDSKPQQQPTSISVLISSNCRQHQISDGADTVCLFNANGASTDLWLEPSLTWLDEEIASLASSPQSSLIFYWTEFNHDAIVDANDAAGWRDVQWVSRFSPHSLHSRNCAFV